MQIDFIDKLEGSERRTISHPVEFREEGEERFFEGYAFVYGEVADLGGFTEEIARGAADEVMNDDVRGLFNHEPDMVLGRNKSGTMTLLNDDTGLRYKIKYNANDPDHVKVMEKVKRGDVSQSSFSFATKDDKWEKRSGKEHRTVLKLKRLYDVAPVTYAAYQNTSVAMRSLTTINEDYKKDLAEMDLVAMKLQLNK
jgi:HK97 family phage prohead protease